MPQIWCQGLTLEEKIEYIRLSGLLIPFYIVLAPPTLRIHVLVLLTHGFLQDPKSKSRSWLASKYHIDDRYGIPPKIFLYSPSSLRPSPQREHSLPIH